MKGLAIPLMLPRFRKISTGMHEDISMNIDKTIKESGRREG
jgi:hypothetical protein